MLLTIGAFALVLGVLIFVHEAGHFIAAKSVGIQVLRFSLGFGKPILSFRRGETEYCISALPLGGYVKMAGLEDEGMAGEIEGGKAAVPVDPARAFDKQGLPARIVVILAGVSMNFVLAVAIFTVLAGTIGAVRTDTTQVDSVRTSGLAPNLSIALGAIHRGDRIDSVNGVPVRTWEDVQHAFLFAPFPLRITLASGRGTVTLAPAVPSDSLRVAIFERLDPLSPPVVDVVTPASPAERAGLKSGDRIVRIGSDTIVSFNQFKLAIMGHAHDSITIRVIRAGAELTLRALPELHETQVPGADTTVMAGYLGISAVRPQSHKRFSGISALGEGWRRSVNAAGAIVVSVSHLASGQGSVRDLGGPIAIASASGQAARAGLEAISIWIAFLSVNLAVLNLLPIPILDGGQLVFLLAEGIRRRPLSLNLRLRLTQVGFVFIILLMTFVIGNDVLRYVFHR